MLKLLRRLTGRETVSDIGEAFPSQSNAVRLALYQWFTAEFHQALPEETPEHLAPSVAAQVVNYLVGDPPGEVSASLEPEGREVLEDMLQNIPQVAANLMAQNRDLRQIIVETLRMRLILDVHCRPPSAERSQLKGRLGHLLGIYGKEFSEEPSPKRYRRLVNNLTTWARSPTFPGAAEQQ